MRLLQELDTPAGHILVCLGVILLGAVFCALRIPKGEDLIVGGSSVLFMAMRAAKQTNGKDE